MRFEVTYHLGGEEDGLLAVGSCSLELREFLHGPVR